MLCGKWKQARTYHFATNVLLVPMQCNAPSILSQFNMQQSLKNHLKQCRTFRHCFKPLGTPSKPLPNSFRPFLNHSKCTPSACKMHSKSIPNAFQKRSKCIPNALQTVPNAFQEHSKCIPKALQVHSKCIPDHSKCTPRHSRPVLRASRMHSKSTPDHSKCTGAYLSPGA